MEKVFLVQSFCPEEGCRHSTPLVCFSTHELARAFIAEHMCQKSKVDIVCLDLLRTCFQP